MRVLVLLPVPVPVEVVSVEVIVAELVFVQKEPFHLCHNPP